jgi:undecaprenyl-diphosphatase
MRSIIKHIETADISSFHWIAKRFNKKAWIFSATLLTRCGDWPTYVIILPLILFITNPSSLSLIFQVYFLDLLIENSLYLIIKKTFKRNRPSDKLYGVNQLIHPPDKFSFPSGHTSSAVGVACIMSYFFPQFALPIIAFACCVSVSRLILKVHFPTDIIAGSLLGVCSAKVALLILI